MKNLATTLCLTIAVLLGSMGVSWSGDYQKGLTAAKSGDFATALREWTPLAEQGNAIAQYNLGLMYRKGRGVPQDDKTAVKWYRLAAKQGDALAQTNLGYMYKNGIGVPQNYKIAVKWYRLAAKQGFAKAQYNLGVMYEKGYGVSQDYKTAVKWYSLAAKQGDAYALKKSSLPFYKKTKKQAQRQLLVNNQGLTPDQVSNSLKKELEICMKEKRFKKRSGYGTDFITSGLVGQKAYDKSTRKLIIQQRKELADCNAGKCVGDSYACYLKEKYGGKDGEARRQNDEKELERKLQRTLNNQNYDYEKKRQNDYEKKRQQIRENLAKELPKLKKVCIESLGKDCPM